MPDTHPTTQQQFEQVMANCRELFCKKLHDYGTAWRIMRPESLTDQIFIKADRIRSIQMKGKAMVDEGIVPEFVAIVNYAIIALIQLEHGAAQEADFTEEQAQAAYDKYAKECLELGQLYHSQARHREHDHQGLDNIGHAGGNAGGRLHGGGAHPQRRKEDGYHDGCQGMKLADEGHGHAVEAVARAEAVN